MLLFTLGKKRTLEGNRPSLVENFQLNPYIQGIFAGANVEDIVLRKSDNKIVAVGGKGRIAVGSAGNQPYSQYVPPSNIVALNYASIAVMENGSFFILMGDGYNQWRTKTVDFLTYYSGRYHQRSGEAQMVVADVFSTPQSVYFKAAGVGFSESSPTSVATNAGGYPSGGGNANRLSYIDQNFRAMYRYSAAINDVFIIDKRRTGAGVVGQAQTPWNIKSRLNLVGDFNDYICGACGDDVENKFYVINLSGRMAKTDIATIVTGNYVLDESLYQSPSLPANRGVVRDMQFYKGCQFVLWDKCLSQRVSGGEWIHEDLAPIMGLNEYGPLYLKKMYATETMLYLIGEKGTLITANFT